MKINKVRINSILGIDELEFDAGKFNIISGQNGQGKTSVLEAIKAALSGGNDATLLRKGSEKGEVVLVLDNGDEIQKRVTEKSSPLSITQDGKKVSKPAETLKALTDMLSVNPIDFLRAPKKDRVRVLLEAMPITVDYDRLSELSGIQVTSAADGLAVIEYVRKQVYDDRTGTNRAVKEKEATINQLQAAMPDVPEMAGDEDALQAQLETARSAKDAELERIGAKLATIQANSRTEIDRIKAEAQAAIAAEMEKLSSIEAKAAQQRERTLQQFQDTALPINNALTAIRTNRSAVAKRQQAESTITQLSHELEALKHDAERQNQAINDIDAYKLELLNALPIPGVEIKDGEIYRNGVIFDRLNTAQQVDIAIEVAKLRAGPLGVVCVDGVELLDSGAFEEFRKRALESELQLFVSKVSDEDFQVKVE